MDRLQLAAVIGERWPWSRSCSCPADPRVRGLGVPAKPFSPPSWRRGAL